jgi:hypothetical protein
MKFIKQHWVTIVAVFGALEAIYNAVADLIERDQAPSGRQLATTAGVALFMWMMKRPTDLTKAQANEHAAKAVRDTVLPPGVESVSQIPPNVDSD